MATTMQFDLVSPERRLASMQASEVRIPGAEGDLTAMPGHARLSPDVAADEAAALAALGVGAVLLFGIPDSKDAGGSAAWDPQGPVPDAIAGRWGLRNGLETCAPLFARRLALVEQQEVAGRNEVEHSHLLLYRAP